MNDRFASKLGSLLIALSIAVLASNVALDQKGKKGGGNGSGGGGEGGAVPVQYRVVQIPYSKGREMNPADISIHGEVCGTVGVTPGPFEGFWYDGQGTTWTRNDLAGQRHFETKTLHNTS